MRGTLAELARSRGWSGIVVNGCIRDVDEINECDIGIRALGSQPAQAGKKVPGEKHVPLFVGGAFIHDGEWLYADADGVVVSKTQLSL
ncbi:hypothetical protein H6P81_008848 [Aristolochia fimbriata]|uniref:4-hydroxy-4-methyl-2-oxoglutarate aldolase n=1 Tax=Aristolochia fimbriata TaxID=158543 RepID=A0AAV7EJ71_ARIFI|nr:hypothetical protein H6P81_008848 [Aristolochia fimbriata]